MCIKRLLLYSLLLLVVLATVAGCTLLNLSPPFGGEVKGDHLAAIQRSPNYSEGQFQNPVQTNMDIGLRLCQNGNRMKTL